MDAEILQFFKKKKKQNIPIQSMKIQKLLVKTLVLFENNSAFFKSEAGRLKVF